MSPTSSHSRNGSTPHPGGRYLEKNSAPLPDNAAMNRAPLYKQSLDKFAFCISGPSSVVFDMIGAGVPVAIWGSGAAGADNGIYGSLRFVTTEQRWFDFALVAAREPEPFLRTQADVIARLSIPADIPGRYRLLAGLAQ